MERIPGFDGEYGVIRLFSAEELNNTEGQMNFFDLLGAGTAQAGGSDADGSPAKGSDAIGSSAGRSDEGGLPAGGECSGEQSVQQEKTSAEPEKGQETASERGGRDVTDGKEKSAASAPVLNPEQAYAVRCSSPHIAVKAGPGTGKTKTLVSRLRYLLEYRKVKPSDITAVTLSLIHI